MIVRRDWIPKETSKLNRNHLNSSIYLQERQKENGLNWFAKYRCSDSVVWSSTSSQSILCLRVMKVLLKTRIQCMILITSRYKQVNTRNYLVPSLRYTIWCVVTLLWKLNYVGSLSNTTFNLDLKQITKNEYEILKVIFELQMVRRSEKKISQEDRKISQEDSIIQMLLICWRVL